MTVATDLAMGQKMALLVLRKHDLAQQILDHLREMSAPEPTPADFAELIKQGRATVRNGIHVLTPGGLFSATDLMRDFARTLGIHSISYANAVGAQGPRATCTCGWGTYQPNGHRALLRLTRYCAQHIEQAREGTLPEAYRLPQFQGDNNAAA